MAKEKIKPKIKVKSISKKQKSIFCGIIMLLALLIYANTFSHQYALDDYSAIKENYVTKKGLKGLPEIWKEHYRFGYWNSAASLYRPLTLTSFALDWQLFPDKPGFAHFTNVLYYGFAGIVLFLVLLKLFSGYSALIPFFISLLFIAHPIHVESVANIKSRDEILAFLFCFLSLNVFWKYISKGNVKDFLLAIILYGLALFSKESAITFVAVYPLCLYFFKKGLPPVAYTKTALFLIPAAIYLVVRSQVVGSLGVGPSISLLDNSMTATVSGLEQWCTAVSVLGRYYFTMLIPFDLSHELGYKEIVPVGPSNWKFLVSLLITLVLAAVAIMGLKKKSIYAFAILFFGISFSILSNIVIKIGTIYGERLLFMPILGYCIGLTFLIHALLKSDLKKGTDISILFKNGKTAYGILILIIGAYSIKTIMRNPAWENSYTLYHTDVQNHGKSAKMNFHYGLELVKFGLDEKRPPEERKEWLKKADAQFNKAIEIYPEYHDAYAQLGLSYYRNKQPQKALQAYEKSISLKPNNAKVYSNMGIIYFEQGNLDKAQEVYEKSVKIDPRFPDALRNLGSVYAMKKNFPQAAKYFTTALKYDPDNATLNLYAGQAYRDGGEVQKAKPYFDKAYRLNPALKK